MTRRSMEAEVPQGSVLGLLLWNVTFDSTLKVSKEPGCHTIRGRYSRHRHSEDVRSAVLCAGIQVARILRQIKRLGLCVSEEKTEAVVFHGRVKPVFLPSIPVGNCRIGLGS